jgi:hypothetical protein
MDTSSAPSGSGSTSFNNNNNKGKGKGKGSRRQDEVWVHFTQSERDSQGHASASCNFCQFRFSRGEIAALQGHIANHCMKAPIILIRKYQSALEENQTKNDKKRKGPEGQKYLDEYHDNPKPLPQGRVDRINRALIKFFVCCGVPFRVVESPFFIDLLKELNSAYNLPSRGVLTNRLLESELGYVNSRVSKELDSMDNLTIGTFSLKI